MPGAFLRAAKTDTASLMLHLDQLKLSLGDKHWNFNTRLETEHSYVLLGESGSGKSTLLNLVAGFLEPVSGDIRWHSDSLLNMPPDQRPVTSLFQQHNLFNHLTVAQNIGLGISPSLTLSEQEHADISSVLRASGLAGYENTKPPTLSGGEQQRVGLARCLLRRKPVLLFDEPFSALDASTRATMTDLLKDVIAEIKPCVLMVSHDPSDVATLNAHSLYLENGVLENGA